MMKIAVIDIDGTIAKVGDRIKYLELTPPDWDAFYSSCFEDEPIETIIRLVRSLKNAYKIVFCTSRRECVRQQTLEWLKRNLFYVPSSDLYMRKDGDKRHDVICKPELLEDAGIQLHDIAIVLEDRNSMVKKWRELGLICLQVCEGDF